VGFSKSNTNNTYNDQSVADDNYRALNAFFLKFPNLVANEFYIAGESYAGIYIPTLATKIIAQNKLPNTHPKINLKGILVGNGCANPRECYEPSQNGEDGMSIYQYEFLYKHNYIVDQDYLLIEGRCTLGYGSEGCKEIRKIVDKKFGETLTQINNIYSPCSHQEIPYLPKVLQGRNSIKAFTTCDDLMGIYHFFNEPEMFTHLHVDPIKFDICSDDVASKYKMHWNGSEYLYPDLIREGLRIWLYSGDVDANVPIIGTLRWLTLMKDLEGLAVIEPWREWWVPGIHKHEDQMGGNVWKLRGLTFVQVKGAGHMVPADKPKEAQVLFESFISGTDLPYKTP
jgi:serine carboxypeptidase-like clade II